MRTTLMAVALLAPALAYAQDAGTLQFGLAGGRVWNEEDSPAHHGWDVMPRFGWFFADGVALEAELPFAFGPMRPKDDSPGSWFLVGPRVHALGYLIQDFPVRPYVLGGGELALIASGGGDEAVRSPALGAKAYGGPGLQINFTENVSVRSDLRWGLMLSSMDKDHRALSDLELTFGVNVSLGKKDSDKDGVKDDDDACPSEPEDKDGFEDTNGCPDPDNDGDGILDDADECDDAKEDVDGAADADGCPDPDNDGDGLLDADDTCPDQMGPAGTQGCPDGDADGIADKDDKCPAVAGVAALKGCPDTDGDGLGDSVDECPTEPGPAASFGCPDGDGDLVPNYRDACVDKKGPEGADPRRSDGCPSRVFATATEIKILEKVYFASGKDVIEARSYGLLDDVAAVLSKYPEILRVEVAGHTDSQGDDAKNLDLSQRRAAAVVTYLAGKGVDASRLVAKGYGETKPIDTNDTSTGRGNNRRVEFTILEQKPHEE